MIKNKPRIVVSDKKGKIFDIPHIEAGGMKGGLFYRLHASDLIKLPYGSEIFMLPNRIPVGYDSAAGEFVRLRDFFAAAAFVSPGYVTTYNSPYEETKNISMLPLFSYSALAFYKGGFYTAALRIDRELRHDLRFMNIKLVKKNAKNLKKLFKHNRLVRHLARCALTYGCPSAKNFFLSRYEAPLPTSPYCNAACIGCISYQPYKKCSITQPRIKFIPAPEEIAEAALYHIKNVKDPIVGFGQGCEGEPLVIGKTVEKAIMLIRKETAKGIINLNTNASMPETIARLFDAGLDSIRVSLNSVRENYYTRYYKPKGYKFKDVLDSIRIAKRKNGFVSINYLTLPGFTDSKDEYIALKNFINNTKIDMIQWRNLNYDPIRYFDELKIDAKRAGLIGVKQIINSLKRDFPDVMMGYFNPSRVRIRRNEVL